MPKPEINILRDQGQVADAFALFLALTIRQRPRTTIALSGGSTPQLLFRRLAEDYAGRIDWSGVHLFWGDERCVPPGHEDSNYGMTKRLLLDRVDIPAANVHRIRGEADPREEAHRYSAEIMERVPEEKGLPAFDIVLLGLGDDGHTASIFPDQLSLLAVEAVAVTARHPGTGQQRISLSGPVINNGRHIAFLVTGAGKAGRVREVLQHEGAWQGYPAAHVEARNGRLLWFIDRAAARGLPEAELPGSAT